MSQATFQQKITGQLNSLVLPRALDLLNFRICHYDRSVDPARPEYNEHVIFSFWHEYIIVVLPRWGHTPLTVLCSQHRDGEWVNQTALALGLNIVRGSTSRGGSSAIRQIKKNSKFSSIAVTPDGPRGPRREMAMGPVYMASLLGMPVVPVGVGISNPYRLNTWDKFAIPKPKSRIRMIFGPKVHIPRKAKRDKLESCREGVERLMNDLTDKAQDWSDSNQKMVGEQPFVRCRRNNKIIFDSKPVVAPQLKVVPAQTPLEDVA
ncbi:MAG: lysophospholipid acyltransferase family protein [Mariniblastus sp.]